MRFPDPLEDARWSVQRRSGLPPGSLVPKSARSEVLHRSRNVNRDSGYAVVTEESW